jgi:hypothetical protein
MRPSRLWKPLCFVLLLAVPVAAIAFASRVARAGVVAHLGR